MDPRPPVPVKVVSPSHLRRLNDGAHRAQSPLFPTLEERGMTANTGFPCSVCSRPASVEHPQLTVEPLIAQTRNDPAFVWLGLVIALLSIIAHVLIALAGRL